MATLIDVPTPGTPKKTVRVDNALWEAFTEASKAKGLTCAENLRQFMRREVENHRQAGASDGESAASVEGDGASSDA